MSRRRNASSFTSARAREAARRRWHPPPSSTADDGGGTAPQRKRGGPPHSGSHDFAGSDSFSARERLEWEAQNSPSATARVAAAKRLLDDEPRRVSEPEVSAVPSRGVDLLDVVSLAVACGVVDLDELVREVRARAPAVESS